MGELQLELQLKSSRPRLKLDAHPSVFAWTPTVIKRSTITSKIAASSLQRCDLRATDSAELLHESPDDLTDVYTEADEWIQDLDFQIRELTAKCQGLETEVKDLTEERKQLKQKYMTLKLS